MGPLYEYDGEAHTLTEWEKITGIGRNTIKGRLNRGWSIEQALNPQKYSLKQPYKRVARLGAVHMRKKFGSEPSLTCAMCNHLRRQYVTMNCSEGALKYRCELYSMDDDPRAEWTPTLIACGARNKEYIGEPVINEPIDKCEQIKLTAFRKRKPLTLSEAARAAKAEGLSYGQWAAKYREGV